MLTDTQLRAMKPTAKQYWCSDESSLRGDGRLKIKVLPTGIKEMYFCYYMDKKQRKIKLGNYKNTREGIGLTLAEARKRRDKYTKILREGIDPRFQIEEQKRKDALAKRKAEEKETHGSLKDLVDSYVEWLKANKRSRADHIAINLERYVLKPWPVLAKRPAREIAVTDIRDIIAKMIRKGITTQCNRVRSQLHAAFQHGLRADNDPRSYLGRSVTFHLRFNPVSGIPVQRDWERVGNRNLSSMELHHFWDQLPGLRKGSRGYCKARMSLVTECYFKLMLATAGQRVEEVLRWEWAWFDWDKQLLDVPPEGTKTGFKTGRGHVIPLSPLALEQLDRIRPITGHCRYVFAGGRGGGMSPDDKMNVSAPSLALRRFYKEYGQDPDTGDVLFDRFAPKDLRRTCKTLMGEAGISKEVRDRLQNHSLSDVSTRHYDRYDYLKEKRAGIAAWTRYLEWIIDGCNTKHSTMANVVPFR